MSRASIERVAFIISGLIGVGLVFIGGRFLLAPEVAEQGFGLYFDEAGNYAFHSIKGIRDVFAGLIILIFAVLRQRQTLRILLGVGALIPLVDMLIVLTNPVALQSAVWIHGSTVVILLVIVMVLRSTRDATTATPISPKLSTNTTQ
jgi:hypothetical protein